MKTLGVACFAVLLAPSCRKAAVPPASEPKPPPAAGAAPAAAPMRVQAPVPKGKDALAENQRSRPNPRPPDVKHPAAPEPHPYPAAKAVPGKQGFVFSPYNNKIVDLRDIPPGTLVADPTEPASAKAYFRAP